MAERCCELGAERKFTCAKCGRSLCSLHIAVTPSDADPRAVKERVRCIFGCVPMRRIAEVLTQYRDTVLALPAQSKGSAAWKLHAQLYDLPGVSVDEVMSAESVLDCQAGGGSLLGSSLSEWLRKTPGRAEVLELVGRAILRAKNQAGT